jgi:aspartate kinase
MQANIPIRVRSTFSEDTGTLVTGTGGTSANLVQDRFVTGIAHVPHITQIQVSAAKGQYDLQLKVFKAMAQQRISVDFINVNPSGVLYTVFDEDAELAVATLRELGYEPETIGNCAKVSIIGGGMNGVPGIMARIMEALTEEDIQILQSADSNATIWVLVQYKDMAKAVQVLHKKFDLHK